MAQVLMCGRFQLSLDRPLIMGVLNVTPDSFSDGGRYNALDRAVQHAQQLVQEGADILDIGGESTRPGSLAVDDQAELTRLLPVIEALHGLNVPLSVDTCKPAVMRGVLQAGADMINDIAGMRDPASVAAVAHDERCAVCVMHMQGQPRTMQQAPHYDDVVAEVRTFLQQQVAGLRQAGVDAARMVLDPGLGFGKTGAHNYTLLRHLQQLFFDDYPWLIGLSRKTMIGDATGRAVQDRLAGSVAGAMAAVVKGAHIVRVHDVAATRDALAVWRAVQTGIPA